MHDNLFFNFFQVNIAVACWAFHYAKRILETVFVHRFSNATMPIMNLFKNCSYYWGFAAYVSYHVNHPLYTAPCDVQVYAGLAAFAFCELGNFSVHWALRCLRPAGNFLTLCIKHLNLKLLHIVESIRVRSKKFPIYPKTIQV